MEAMAGQLLELERVLLVCFVTSFVTVSIGVLLEKGDHEIATLASWELPIAFEILILETPVKIFGPFMSIRTKPSWAFSQKLTKSHFCALAHFLGTSNEVAAENWKVLFHKSFHNWLAEAHKIAKFPFHTGSNEV